MELHLLANIQFLSQFNENAIDCIEIIAVIASRRGEVQYCQIIFILNIFNSYLGLNALMVLVPLDQQSFFAHAAVPLDDEGMVVFDVFWLHGEPLLNHEVVLFETAAFLVLVEPEHDIGGTA